ncbi:MAG TPA: site-2 protease family protein [Solirubrobacteraceae bacterium]|jgi:Zn-dependent protease/predicted transcriptional regulator|nr:site-2 protease family protein [Solirubrobacteraceae bacterium]
MPIRSSLRFGRVAGIEIGASWSWLIIVAIVFFTLATSVFPETNAGLSDAGYAAMAAAAVLLFFASLTAHELGHAIQARRDGMEIDGITLWVFGGVARFRGEFPSAGAELRIALAGPVVSLVLGVVFLGAALLVDLPSGVDGVVFWLGQINLTLLVFNLLPALPLDGGRVLRALLWIRRGNFAAATRTAAAMGRGFGQGLFVMGLVLVLVTGAFAGLWLALIGLFLIGAAEAEGQMAETRDALADLRVRDVMVAEPVSVPPDMALDRFMDEVFMAHRHTAYPVVGADGSPLGMVSFRQVVALPREDWPRRTVRDVMVPIERAIVVRSDADLRGTYPRLATDGLRRALVQDHGQPLGLLSLTDVMRVLEAAGGRGARRLGGEP